MASDDYPCFGYGNGDARLDPDAPLGKTYWFRKRFPEGDGFDSVAVDEVDESSSTVLTGGLLVTKEAAGLEDGSSDIWAVRVRMVGNGVVPGWHYVRFRYTTLAGNGDDQTFKVLVGNN